MKAIAAALAMALVLAGFAAAEKGGVPLGKLRAKVAQIAKGDDRQDARLVSLQRQVRLLQKRVACLERVVDQPGAPRVEELQRHACLLELTLEMQ